MIVVRLGDIIVVRLGDRIVVRLGDLIVVRLGDRIVVRLGDRIVVRLGDRIVVRLGDLVRGDNITSRLGLVDSSTNKISSWEKIGLDLVDLAKFSKADASSYFLALISRGAVNGCLLYIGMAKRGEGQRE